MYGVSTETKVGGGARMSGGINENASLVSAAFESPRKDGTGDPVIILNFDGPTGTYKHVEWEVVEKKIQEFADKEWDDAQTAGAELLKRDKKPYTSREELVKDRVANAFTTANSRLKHIAGAFEEDESKIVFDGQTYEAIGRQFVAFLEARKNRNKVDLLLTLDKKLENLNFPPFPPFIQKAGTQPTRLKVTKWIRTGSGSTPDTEAGATEQTINGQPIKHEEPEF